MAALLFPLGYPLELESNSAEVQTATRESWGGMELLFHEPPIRFMVRASSGPEPPGRPRLDLRADRMDLIWNEANHACFIPAERRGCMHVASGVFLAERLNTVILTALDALFFTPLHAACVERNGRGVLLLGNSGAGKSTLAYACARSGWTFVSDDSLHAPHEPLGLVVGNSKAIHLREPARALFPELENAPAGIAPNGKTAIAIDPARYGFHTAPATTAAHFVFLRRTPGPPKLSRLNKDSVLPYFRIAPWTVDLFGHGPRQRELLAAGPLLLEYETPYDAVKVLDVLVETA